MKTVAELLRVKPSRVISVRPEQTVLEAIKILAQENIGAADKQWPDVQQQAAQQP